MALSSHGNYLAGYYGRYAPKGGELKFFDTTRALVAAAAAGAITNSSLNLIPQDATESGRIGRKCVLKSVMLKGVVVMDVSAAAGEADQSLRVIVYCDKQCNGATAAAADLIDGPLIHGFRNLSNVSRFKVLYDKTTNCPIRAIGQSAAGTYTTMQDSFQFQIYKKVNIPLEFSGATGAITELATNNIGVLIFSYTGQRLPRIAYTCRVRFSDN